MSLTDGILLAVIILAMCIAGGVLLNSDEYHRPAWAAWVLIIGTCLLFIAGCSWVGDQWSRSAVVSFYADKYDVPAEDIRITAFNCDFYGRYGTCFKRNFEVRFNKNGDSYVLRGTIDGSNRVFPDKPVPNQLKGARILRSLLILLLLLLPSSYESH